MRKTTSRVSVAALGALALTMTAGGFALAPASGTAAAAPLSAPAAGGPSAMLHQTRVVQNSMLRSSATTASSTSRYTASDTAGYMAAGGTTTFRFISAHFNVPYLNCNGVTASQGATSDQWVGLGGSEATGVNTTCSGTQASYSAWWAVTSSGGSPGITIHPGDAIDMSTYYNRSTHQFTLTFSDTSDGQHFTRTRSCPSGTTCYRDSADAFTTAEPNQSTTNALMPLSGFQAAAFSNVKITNTTGTHRGGLQASGWNTYRFDMQAGATTNPPLTNYDTAGNPIPAGTSLAKTTPLYTSNSFLVYWLPANAG